MRRLVSLRLLFVLMAALTACTAACAGSTDLSGGLKGEGIAPYELSESEHYILQSFNMDNTSLILSFYAPEEAASLKVTSATGFLQEFQRIGMNTEIPVALMVYDSGTIMKSYSLQDYFEPSKLEGMDLVQAVTLEFSDN